MTTAISAYFQNLSGLDVLIWLIGGTIAILSGIGIWWLNRKGRALDRREVELMKARYQALLRFGNVGTDLLPLLGLLGTALAILNTFFGLSGTPDSSEIVANFAPALTTTVSGIGFAIVNTFVIQGFLVPACEQFFPE